jgi:hypothetical protein
MLSKYIYFISKIYEEPTRNKYTKRKTNKPYQQKIKTIIKNIRTR